MSYYSLGDSFKWFIARVIDIKDPEYLGRVKIRVIHEQTGQLGKKKKTYGLVDDDLLWAYPISAIQSASLAWKKVEEMEGYPVPPWIDAVGLSPTGLAIGSYVYGFYLDGHEQNIPLIFGTYHKLSVYPEPPTDPQTGEMLQTQYPKEDKEYFDIAALAKGFIYDPENKNTKGGQTLPKEPYAVSTLWGKEHSPVDEFPTAYNTDYPYNLTYTTKAGHAIELDDSLGAERIHIWHKSGSYEEISSGINSDVDDDDSKEWPKNGPVGYSYVTAGGTPEDEFDGRRSRKTMDSFFDVVVKDKNELTLRDHNAETANTETVKVGNNTHYSVGYIGDQANRGNAKGELGSKNYFIDVANNFVQTAGNNHVVSVGHATSKVPSGQFNQQVYIANNQTIEIGHNQVVNIGDNCTITVGKNCTIIVKGDASISVDGTTSVNSKGNMSLHTDANMDITAGGTLNMTSGGAMTIDGSSIDIG